MVLKQFIYSHKYNRKDKVLLQLFQKLVGVDKVHGFLIFIFSSNCLHALAIILGAV